MESSIDAVMWDEEEGAWFDFDTLAHTQREEDDKYDVHVHNDFEKFLVCKFYNSNIGYCEIQRLVSDRAQIKGGPLGWVNFGPAVAYHFYLAMTAAFTQHGTCLPFS